MTVSQNRQSYFPQVDKSIDPKVTRHLQETYQAINDHDQAIGLLKTQLDDVVAGKTVIKQTTTVTSSTTTSGVTSFNAATGAITYFPNLGSKDDQSGNTTYTLQQSDSGAVVIFSDASAVAVALNPAITTPFFCIVVNWGVGTVTFTPTSPALINYYANLGATSMPLLTGNMAILQFDGTNWNAATIEVPVTFNAISHEWLRSYDSTTGLFTASQPDFTDLSGQIAPATQIPASGVTAGSYEAANITVNAEGLVTAAANGVLSGVSASLGGSAMTAGQTITIAVTVTGAAVGMVSTCSPETYPGDGFVWDAYISAANTVTVRLTATIAGTPVASIYDVRVTK